MSTRALLRAAQRMREGVDEGFNDDLRLLQSKDMDLSIRLGALLAFNALLMTAAFNPLAASPGAPLSLDAARQPWEVAAVSLSIALLAAGSWLCVRAIMIGEEFHADGIEDDPRAIAQRMLAAYCASADAQLLLLGRAARFTISGGIAAALACLWVMVAKMIG